RLGYVDLRRETDTVGRMIDQLAIRTTGPDQIVGALSGGNQQKVLIGRWLVTNARILLLYDVTRGVDVATKHDIYDLVTALSAEGRAILYYSSDTAEVAHLCHRVLVLREGGVATELRGAIDLSDGSTICRSHSLYAVQMPHSAGRLLASSALILL